MSMLEKIWRELGLCMNDAASLLKVALLSKRVTAARPIEERELVILGNGPSLRQTIDESRHWLDSHELMAVNFAANAPEFRELRPERYILADPHFFRAPGEDANVDRLWENLRNADWPMTLHVPAREQPRAAERLADTAIRIESFNLTPVEGHAALTRLLTRRGLGMPRPRNVLIPAIICAINAGYGRIFLAGADHSWSRTLSVDDHNRVVSIQPHFYADNSKELDRVSKEYEGYRLHDILQSLTIAFRSYFAIAEYASRRGAEIINVTPGSMIDAFPRLRLPADADLTK